jgi:hypothetical protein
LTQWTVETPFRWDTRSQFFCVTVRTMRQSDGHQRIALDDVTGMANKRTPQRMALDHALTELALRDLPPGPVVELFWLVALTRELVPAENTE